MKWHCLADIFKYCNGEPDFAGEEEEVGEGNSYKTLERKCKLTPETCGRCQRLEEQVDLTVPWLSKPNYVETIISIEKPKDESKKPMGKKAKKLEAEMAQRSMF